MRKCHPENVAPRNWSQIKASMFLTAKRHEKSSTALIETLGAPIGAMETRFRPLSGKLENVLCFLRLFVAKKIEAWAAGAFAVQELSREIP